MHTTFFTPQWFYGYDILFHVLFAACSITLAILANRLFRLTDQKQAGLFSKGFMLISAAYITKIAMDLILVWFGPLEIVSDAGGYIHSLLMVSGILVLLYMTFNVNNRNVLFAMIALSAVALMLYEDDIIVFYLISTVSLAFISVHFIRNYLKNKRAMTLLTALAFFLLLASSFPSLYSAGESTYVLAHVIELGAYLLIILNFYLVFKK
jgi:hypothetical protein